MVLGVPQEPIRLWRFCKTSSKSKRLDFEKAKINEAGIGIDYLS